MRHGEETAIGLVLLGVALVIAAGWALKMLAEAQGELEADFEALKEREK